jgi:hypothetical protein
MSRIRETGNRKQENNDQEWGFGMQDPECGDQESRPVDIRLSGADIQKLDR